MEKKLLIIDDNKEIVDIVSLVLSDMFDTVESAFSVEEAEVFLTKSVYSFIVLDINLGGRSGAEVIKFLGESPKNANHKVPFIIVSGVITPQFVKRNENRFAGILMKPFRHDELRKKVEEILKGQKSSEQTSIMSNVSDSEIPSLRCNYPFAIIQLEKRVQNILENINSNTELNKLFSKLTVAPNYNPTRVGTLVNVSTAICLQMEWNTDKTLEKFVYAAYLYDMAGNIEDIRGIPSDVAMIIRQYNQHQEDDNYQSIAQLSVVFIIAQDLMEFVMSNPKWSIEEYLVISNKKFKAPQFSKILQVLSNFE